MSKSQRIDRDLHTRSAVLKSDLKKLDIDSSPKPNFGQLKDIIYNNPATQTLEEFLTQELLKIEPEYF